MKLKTKVFLVAVPKSTNTETTQIKLVRPVKKVRSHGKSLCQRYLEEKYYR